MFRRNPAPRQSVCPKARISNPAFPENSSTQRPQISAELVLIRGLPGSGKSTMARKMASAGFEHFEADMFFTVNGVYSYDASQIREAHFWCQQKAREALASGRQVVVSNTFTRLQELEPYGSMTKNIRILEACGKWDNVHSVPAETVRRMAKRWEPLLAN